MHASVPRRIYMLPVPSLGRMGLEKKGILPPFDIKDFEQDKKWQAVQADIRNAKLVSGPCLPQPAWSARQAAALLLCTPHTTEDCRARSFRRKLCAKQELAP